MPCNNSITQSLINACNPVKGIEPIIYWDYRSNLAFTFVDNTITAITAPPLGRIEVKKFGINAGFEVVAIENQSNRFKHKLDTVINDNSIVLDAMDDIVFFVKENGTTTWKVLGAKYGLWKTAQAAMANDNMNTIAVSFESREGMEEEYEVYNTSIDIAALPNMESFDLIYGGTIENGGDIKFIIDADKVGYIKLPNGVLLTNNGGTFTATYSGVGGNITFYVQKNNTVNNIRSALYHGKMVYNGANYVQVGANYITSFTANNTLELECGGCPYLTELIATIATDIAAPGSALTAKSIGDILYAAYVANRMAVVFDFSGRPNALEGAVDTYLQATYGVTYDAVFELLDTDNGGTISIDTV